MEQHMGDGLMEGGAGWAATIWRRAAVEALRRGGVGDPVLDPVGLEAAENAAFFYAHTYGGTAAFSVDRQAEYVVRKYRGAIR